MDRVLRAAWHGTENAQGTANCGEFHALREYRANGTSFARLSSIEMVARMISHHRP